MKNRQTSGHSSGFTIVLWVLWAGVLLWFTVLGSNRLYRTLSAMVAQETAGTTLAPATRTQSQKRARGVQTHLAAPRNQPPALIVLPPDKAPALNKQQQPPDPTLDQPGEVFKILENGLTVSLAWLAKDNKISVLLFGFEPEESVVLTFKDSEQTIGEPVSFNADGVGSLQTMLDPPPEVTNLSQITVEGTGESKSFSEVLELTEGAQAPLSGATPQPTDQQATPTTMPATNPLVSPTPTPLIPVILPTSTPFPPTATSTPSPTPSPSPTVMPNPNPHYPNWYAEYYKQTNMNGEPDMVRNHTAISFNWRDQAPVPGLNANNFAVRWTREIELPEGRYDFVLAADDLAEVYVNGELFMSHRGVSPRATRKSYFVQNGQKMDIEVRYYEYWGEASIHFYWEPGIANRRCWQGTYYCTCDFTGITHNVPVHEELNLRVEGNPAPASLPADRAFSGYWTRQIKAPHRTGEHLLCVYVKDGARVWLEDRLVLDAWEDGPPRLRCSRVHLDAQLPHNVKIDHYHASGTPLLGFWIIDGDANPWIGAYFDNPHLLGLPEVIKTDMYINFDWTTHAPYSPHLPADNFSAYWVRQQRFPVGESKFHLTYDDGVQLLINDVSVFYDWQQTDSRKQVTVPYPVQAGAEDLKIELKYLELNNSAIIRLIEETPPPAPD